MAFVGREAELDTLAREVALAFDLRIGRSIFIQGPPGAGKTALASEFLERLADEQPTARIARGRCLQTFGSADPYLPFVDALRDLADQSTAGSVQGDTVASLLTELAPYWLSVVPVVGGLLSAGFATAAKFRGGTRQEVAPSREALFVQYLELIRRLAHDAPLVLFLDDVHWADQASVALLTHLTRGVASLPVLVVATLRADEATLEQHPIVETIRELEREDLAKRVALDELDGDELDALIAAEFCGDVAPPLRRWVVETAGGNPLFAVELVRLLKQSGGAVEQRGEWNLTDAVHALEVPRTAEAAIETRVQRLDPEQIRVLQYASIEGNEFSSTVLAGVLDQDELELLDALDHIERRYQLVQATGELDLPDGDVATQFRFHHALVQTVLYRQVIGKRRLLLHRKCGEVLERLFADETAQVEGKLARHFHEGRVPERAHQYARSAGDSARRVYAHWEAEEFYRLALEHSPDAQDAAALEERLGDIYDAVGYYDRGVHALQRSLAGREGDDAGRLRLRRKILMLQRKAGATPAPLLLQQVRALLAEAAGPSSERCKLLLEIGRFPDAVGIVEAREEAVRIAESLDDPSLLAHALEQLAVAMILSAGRTQEALPLLQRASAIGLVDEDPVRAAHHHNIAGIAHAKLGQYGSALRDFERMLAVSERVGQPHAIAGACDCLGELLLRLGRFDEAEEVLQRALTIHERRDRQRQLHSLENLAERARLAGDLELAVERYERLLERAQEFEYWTFEALAHAGVGWCRLSAGDAAAAQRCAERVVASLADRDDAFQGRDVVELFLAQMEKHNGQVERAVRRLERASAALRSADVYLWARLELERACILADHDAESAQQAVERVRGVPAEVRTPPLQARLEELCQRLATTSP